MKSFISMTSFIGIIIFLSLNANAQQSVGIGTDFPDPHSSLEISSVSTGILITRMTTAQRNGNILGLNATHEGLLIYNLTDTEFNYWDGTQWLAFPGGDDDWFEDGTPPGPPDNINDAIFTNNSVGIGVIVPTQTLHLANTSGALQSIRVDDLSQFGNGHNPPVGTVSLANRATVFVDRTNGIMYSEDANRAFWRLDGNAGVVNAGYSGSCPNLIAGSMNASGYEYIGTNDNTDFIVATNDIERLRVLRDGQLVAYGKGIATPASSPTGCVPAYPTIDAASFYGTGNIYPLNAYSENVPAVFGAAQGVGLPAGVAGEINFDGYGVWGYVDLGASFNSIGVFGEEATLAGWGVWSEGDMNFTNLLFNISDASLKENINTYTGGLEAILQLKPKSYTIKPEYQAYGMSDETKIGFLAQDVQQIFPELVKLTNIPAPHSVKGQPETRKKTIENKLALSTLSLIPVLTSAIQEQQSQIDVLKAENADIKKRLLAMEAKLFTPPPAKE